MKGTMRILHFADLHLGIETYGRTDPATGLSTRLLDFLRALDDVVDYAIAERVHLVLFCGDAYKGRDPTQTHQRALATRIRTLLDAGIPVFLLAGNHDIPANPYRATTLDIFSTLQSHTSPSSSGILYTARVPGTHTIETRAGFLQIVALPWPTPATFPPPPGTAAMTIDNLLQHIAEQVSSFIQDATTKLANSYPSILAAHVGLATHLTALSSEQTMTLGLHPLFTPSQLHPELFDYVALGHIHQHQVLDGPTPIVYAGSLQPTDFGEEGDDKGFYHLELDPSRPRGHRLTDKPTFCPVRARQFVTVTASPSNPNPTPEVIAAIEAADTADAIVRLHINLSQAQVPLLDPSALTQALAPAHSVAYIRRHVDDDRHQPRLPDTLHPESLAPLDALHLYLSQQQVPDHRKATLIGHARTLLERTG